MTCDPDRRLLRLLGSPAAPGASGPTPVERTPAPRSPDALHEEVRARDPALANHADALRATVAERYRAQADALRDAVPDAFPDDADDADAAPDDDADGSDDGVPGAATTVAALDLDRDLRSVVTDAALDTLDVAAADATAALEADVAAACPGDVTVTVDCDARDTFAARYLRRQLDRDLAAVAAAVERALGAILVAVACGDGDADDARRAVSGALDDLAARHAPLVASAATLAAARYASQAVAESTSLVTEKAWQPPASDATCPVHDHRDDPVAVECSFRVPTTDPDRPRAAFVVGEDRPLACRCSQAVVLGSVPADPRDLAAADGVTVTRDGDRVEPLSDREREVRREHARDGERFEALVRRVHDSHSVAGGARHLGVTKKTLYRWFDKYVEGFDRYSGS